VARRQERQAMSSGDHETIHLAFYNEPATIADSHNRVFGRVEFTCVRRFSFQWFASCFRQKKSRPLAEGGFFSQVRSRDSALNESAYLQNISHKEA
jgi:hypothetical protein